MITNENIKKFVLVTDPLCSPAYLVERFNQEGYGVIALQIFNNHSQWLVYEELPFYAVIRSTGSVLSDVEAIQAIVEEGQLVAGFYGFALSVDYADKILNHLFPQAANTVETSQLRYDKYEMAKCLDAELGVNTKQLRLSHREDINLLINRTIQFFNENGRSIVIKPVGGSALSSAVCIPKEEVDIIWYYKFGEKPLFTRSDYLLQEYFSGKQYYVNTASFQGRHSIVEVGLYEKIIANHAVHCLYDEPVNIGTTLYENISKFTTIILKSIQMQNGLSHIEIVARNNGFALIEVNPRIAGALGYLNRMSKNLIGVDQIDDYVCMIEKRPFKLRVDSKVKQRLVMIRHCNFEQYKVIENLETYSDSSIHLQYAHLQENRPKIIGVVLLKSNSESAIQDDYEKLVTANIVFPKKIFNKEA